MYAREKLCNKSRKSDKDIPPPSFSSTLLDEIYRSIDGSVEKSDDLNGYKEAASSRRACLVEKWMEKEANERAAARRKRQQFLRESDTKSAAHDSDVIFFSSTSSSSDSSGALSSSDTEFFGSTGGRSKPKVSCFTARPKPVRTGSRSEPDRFKPDDRQDDLIKSKSRALKIYANLKKVKQPISPGGRLTSFINSLFSNAGGKKSRSLEARDDRSVAACSSASSFSRSCLSKYSPRSREKMRDGGERRTVKFEPAVVDRDLRSGGGKSVYSGDSGRFGRPPLPPPELKMNKKAEFVAQRQNSNSKRGDVFNYHVDEYEDEEDCLSDSSSDLFELDHLTFFGSNRYSEELPVYETTHFNTNCAIASGLIR
ncbi:protein BIG GRAIN 1-like B [Salvia miltiorrhiza]|uniref:protein BIG GRAIN 1-like B n=1 Tax=Salvia miltiorrhiza TaxID=226208 RepID=UPI0025AB7131|nr:protein BIG GRAIN 1-like B [Salvia miltiorrhiza]